METDTLAAPAARIRTPCALLAKRIALLADEAADSGMITIAKLLVGLSYAVMDEAVVENMGPVIGASRQPAYTQ